MIVHLRVFLELFVDVVEVVLKHLSAADRAPLVLGHLILDLTPELVFLLKSLHEPITVETDQVETVEALVDTH